MEPIKFKLTFVTPLLVHGANSKQADPIGLSGKALRGVWRFWFRALVGGAMPGIAPDVLASLEQKVFGSADEGMGGTFRMKILHRGELIANRNIFPGFLKTYTRNGRLEEMKFSGHDQGCTFTVSVMPRITMDVDSQDMLLAAIWLWSALGSVGQRARRGFGSPLMNVVNTAGNQDRFADLGLSVPESFKDRDAVVSHISSGLIKVWEIFSAWLNRKIRGTSTVGRIYTNSCPANPQFFILSSFEQISVGNTAESDMGNVLASVHGSDACKGIGWVSGKRRFSSPVYTRLYKIDDGYLPVTTYSYQSTGIACGVIGHTTGSVCAREYLNRFRCTNWLSGGAI